MLVMKPNGKNRDIIIIAKERLCMRRGTWHQTRQCLDGDVSFSQNPAKCAIFHMINMGSLLLLFLILLTYKNNQEPKFALNMFATVIELMLFLKSYKLLTFSVMTFETKIGKTPQEPALRPSACEMLTSPSQIRKGGRV